MGIEREKGEIWLVCDDCMAEHDTFDNREFMDMIDAAKDDGWLILNRDGTFEHYCPDCRRNA